MLSLQDSPSRLRPPSARGSALSTVGVWFLGVSVCCVPRRGWRRSGAGVLQVEAWQWATGAVSLTALEAKG
jgi:hypothetical protein